MLIQSQEGQDFLKATHAAAMQTLKQYPCIHKHVHDDEWGEDYLRDLLTNDGNIGDGSHPALYFWAAHPSLSHAVPPCEALRRTEEALEWIIRKARKQNRQDLVRSLRAGKLAAVYETWIGWALLSHFGEDNVAPYPRISRNSKKTVDFAAGRGRQRILFEVTTLFDPRPTRKTRSSGMSAPSSRYTWHKGRLFRTVRKKIAKVTDAGLREPFVLCVFHQAVLPSSDDGMQIVRAVASSNIIRTQSSLVGLAYARGNQHIAFSPMDMLPEGVDLDQRFIEDVKEAMRLLS